MQQNEELERKLAQLAATFVEQIPARVEQMDAQFALIENNQGLEAVEGLRNEAHKLVGSSGTFGLPEISRDARTLEQTCLGGANVEAISRAFDLLKETIERETASVRARVEAAPAGAVASERGSESRTVLILSADEAEKKRLADQVRTHGFAAEVDAANLPEGGCFAVVSDLAAASQLTDVPGLDGTEVIFIGDGDGITQRLEATRRGGASFLARPVDATALLRRLNALADRRLDEAPRVMIVDDDPVTGQIAQAILEKAGMTVRLTTDPLKTLDDLDQFVPDVFIIDLLMPECSGAELAAVICQDERLVDIPVLFLSGEQSAERQAEAMAAGGSAFMAKPVSGKVLIPVLGSLVERSRRIRGAASRDPLTGVFTHSYIKMQLGRELSRVDREKGKLTLAVLSIDHFGALNEAYGYAMGDKVLRYLAASLNARLRRTDACGRLKGAKFAVILPDAPPGEAAALIKDIARTLADMEVVEGQGAGGLSFSCGLAENVKGLSAEGLFIEANDAFEQARGNGGDRIVTAKTKTGGAGA